MSLVRSVLLSAMVCLGVGCAVERDGAGAVSEADPAAAEVQQELVPVGGGSCPAKDNCYWLCRFRFHCTSASTCNQLSQCLNQCDAEFPTCQ